MKFVKTDGGRVDAGYFTQPRVGDCVTRAITIASGRPYREVYQAITEGNSTQRMTKKTKAGMKTASDGVYTTRKWFKDYMKSLGFRWVPTMGIGTGCKVHLRDGELPMGRIVVNLSLHLSAVIDGVIYDTHDPSRDGTRCVYGYWILDPKAVPVV